jgi:hypothetical protein
MSCSSTERATILTPGYASTGLFIRRGKKAEQLSTAWTELGYPKGRVFTTIPLANGP